MSELKNVSAKELRVKRDEILRDYLEFVAKNMKKFSTELGRIEKATVTDK